MLKGCVSVCASAKLPINNEHEWDPLHHCVMGRYQSYLIPPMTPEVKATVPYGTDTAFNFYAKHTDQQLADASPTLDTTFKTQLESMVKIVESRGVKVERNKLLDKYSKELYLFTQIYMRDPIIVIGKKVIVANLQADFRRLEVEGFQDLIAELKAKYDCEVIHMPSNDGLPESEQSYLEGGDVHVNGNEIYCGCSGNASNDKGIQWLKNTLGPKYTVYKVPLKRDVLHLDCCMMLLNPTHGILCFDDLQDRKLPGKLANYKWIEATRKEANYMATNGISLDKNTVVMDKAHQRVIKEVKKLGITVIEVPYEKGPYLSGSLRCTYQPLYRSNPGE